MHISQVMNIATNVRTRAEVHISSRVAGRLQSPARNELSILWPVSLCQHLMCGILMMVL